MLFERIQRSDLGKTIELVLAKRGDAEREVVDTAEGARGDDRAASLFAQSLGVAQSESQVLALDGAFEIGARDIDREHAQSMALCVLDEDGRRVKAHRLVVQHRAGELGEVVALQICAGISDQREAGGVRFWKSVESEGRDGADD